MLINFIGRIIFLSLTYEGKTHDKTICDEQPIAFPEETILLQDLGFQGHYPKNVTVLMPCKASKLHPLNETQKQSNRSFSSQRVKVEHAISGVKRSRIVKDVFRNWRNGFEDEAMEIACGLHNLRILFRKFP